MHERGQTTILRWGGGRRGAAHTFRRGRQDVIHIITLIINQVHRAGLRHVLGVQEIKNAVQGSVVGYLQHQRMSGDVGRQTANCRSVGLARVASRAQFGKDLLSNDVKSS